MGATRLCFLLFCLFLASVSSVEKLSNIDDLKSINYGKSAPRHGLQLLFWFAQKVLNVDQNNILILEPNFDPHRGDFGFHRYLNKEGILPSLGPLQNYYMVGNLKPPGAKALPAYVGKYYRNTNVPQRNMDRLIVSMERNRPQRIHKVFITSHNLHKNDFNPSDTYEIDPALILQIGDPHNCTLDQNNNYAIYTILRNTQDKICDRLNTFLTETGYSSTNCTHSHSSRRKKRSPYLQCKTYEGIKLEMKATTQGYSKLIWEIPAEMKNYFKYVHIEICQNTYSSDTNDFDTQVRKQLTIYESSGDLDTDVYLKAGLQPRLLLRPSDFHFTDPYIWYGPEFDGANGMIPTRIKGFDASLQLYAEDGKACARLYIKKTFSDWKDVLYYSWVGFYKSSQDKNKDYSTYQYAKKFSKTKKNDITHNYDIYQYDSSLAIAPGVQIRFLQDKTYNKVLAQTAPWEGVEEMTILPSDCKQDLQSEPSSNGPEFFYGPEFDKAGLQLFTMDGKACARLYIKRTFTDWKETFSYSWVGFYTSSKNKNDDYYTYHYVVKFEKIEDDNENYDIYQYKSKLDIAPGVQIRFMIDKSADKASVETEPWKSG